MDEQFLQYLSQGNVATNIGPTAREALLQQAEEEYLNGNLISSIFYQTSSLYQTSQEHYYNAVTKRKSADVEDLMAGMNAEETTEFKGNCLLQYVSKSLKQMQKNKKSAKNSLEPGIESNFLKGISDPIEGVHKIEDICKQLPTEWTILQLCKGPRTETTFSIYPKIHESDAAIYLTILKHARSDKYPTPICMRFCNSDQKELYENFSSVVNRFKNCVKVDPKEWHTVEVRKLYWRLLSELNSFIKKICADLKKFFFPWNFLFTGLSYLYTSNDIDHKRWHKVDAFCDQYDWDEQSRVLLSLAASSVKHLSAAEIETICTILAENMEHKKLAVDMLVSMQQQSCDDCCFDCKDERFPCILVVDERLDHFFWEEMNVDQEFTRINSLQCLWRLYGRYKKDIKSGYLNVNITNGGCVINPDQNLSKMEVRMRSFFEYWTPHWTMIVGQKPTEEELFNFFKRHCYVYAGHGSGLQYMRGRSIAKLQMQCVVFLFGCDSTRLHSNGLYSELVGPHLYYHGAMCPALVGTLMPCLDSIMDKVATEILSRWIAPKSTNILPWNEIEEKSWVKQGLIKPKSDGDVASAASTTSTMATKPDYHSGSLCGILSMVHRGVTEPTLYNTVPYVCRGLPVWNVHVEPLPTL